MTLLFFLINILFCKKNKVGQIPSDVAGTSCKELFEEVKQLKVVVIGKWEVGKTTLVKKILSSTSRTSIKIPKPKRTDGVEMHQWEIENTMIQVILFK